MSGLLLKDWYTLVKQMKFLLLVLAVLACIPGYSMPAFAVFYAAMLPVTALAYDERSKWDELAVMMPYSTRDIVLSKYVLGILSVLAAEVIATSAQLLTGLIRRLPFEQETALSLLFIACFSLILLAVNLPIIFKLGVEKGRIAFLILICGGVVAGMALSDNLIGALQGMDNMALPVAGVLLLTAAIFIVSIAISVRIYREKRV